MILTPSEMKAAEEAVFAQGIVAEDLMEKAGLGIAQAVSERFPQPGRVVAYLGKGHNAGDALVAGRHLQARGWEVSLRDVAPPKEGSPLTQKKRAEFLAGKPAGKPTACSPLVLLDGLLGIGARGPLRGDYQTLAREINARHEQERAIVVAIDVPTGLDGETGAAVEEAVRADHTVTIAYAKTGLLADAAIAHVGTLEVIPLPEITPPSTGGDSARVLTAECVRTMHRRRPVDHFKNRAGHVAILAGSLGLTGAAAMAAEAALTAGAGLISLHVPQSIYSILATRCAPEIMVHALPEALSVETLAGNKATVFAVGPGWGSSPDSVFLDWLQAEERPVVIDADGLNFMAHHPETRSGVAQAGPRLLTPHPGEFARLFPEEAALPTRRQRAEKVIAEYPLTLLLKGTRSIVAHPGEPTSFNLTGNPGMATGGMGDVLTGVCAGLAAQGYALPEAACLGAWLCGRAADIAVQKHGATHETLRATDVIRDLAGAFRDLQ